MKLSVLTSPKFQAALRKLNSGDIPAKTAFRLKGMTKKIQEALDRYEEVRQTSLNQHGNKDDKGNLVVNDDGSVQLSKDGMEAFVKDISELTNEEVELGTIGINDLGEKLDLSVEDLIVLEGLVVE